MKEIYSKNLIYREVDGTAEQIEILYDLLKKRRYSISHTELPSFSDHREFVDKNPYRYWFLIYLSEEILGNFYIQFDNSIGLNIKDKYYSYIDEIVHFIERNFKPNKELKSKVAPYFSLNVPYANIELRKFLDEMTLTPIQCTYRVNTDDKNC